MGTREGGEEDGLAGCTGRVLGASRENYSRQFIISLTIACLGAQSVLTSPKVFPRKPILTEQALAVCCRKQQTSRIFDAWEVSMVFHTLRTKLFTALTLVAPLTVLMQEVGSGQKSGSLQAVRAVSDARAPVHSSWPAQLSAAGYAQSMSPLQVRRNVTSRASVTPLLFLPIATYDSEGAAAISVAVKDVNGDGSPDVLVANYCGDSACAFNAKVGVLLGNGDGTFQPGVSYDLGGYPASSMAVADLNGDGKTDIVVTVNEYVSVLLGNVGSSAEAE